MNVGELRRALENVSDTREVVVRIRDGGEERQVCARAVESAKTREMCYILGNIYAYPESFPDLPDKALVFVIE